MTLWHRWLPRVPTQAAVACLLVGVLAGCSSAPEAPTVVDTKVAKVAQPEPTAETPSQAASSDPEPVAVSSTPDPATAGASKYLLAHLASKGEHVSGYDRSLFTLWADADHDGCDAREEVLTEEAVKPPNVGSGCALTDGRWVSKYDGLSVTNPSGFDIDHLVPLNEAWQSGAWRWNAATRKAYANDLGYKASLIAVSAHSNRSKGDREPQDWMPDRTSYACTYLSQWVAVKWRWHLSVDAAERSFLTRELKACGWPRVAKPKRPPIHNGPPVGGGGGTTPASSTSGATMVGYAVHPGAFCAEHWAYGRTSAGTRMRCTTTASDARFRWRSA
jgi:hypothetical protein